jgi:hypothetical protein
MAYYVHVVLYSAAKQFFFSRGVRLNNDYLKSRNFSAFVSLIQKLSFSRHQNDASFRMSRHTSRRYFGSLTFCYVTEFNIEIIQQLKLPP